MQCNAEGLSGSEPGIPIGEVAPSIFRHRKVRLARTDQVKYSQTAFGFGKGEWKLGKMEQVARPEIQKRKNI